MESVANSKLIEKYWKGETTQHEEKMLKWLVVENPELFTEKDRDYFQSLVSFDDTGMDKEFTMKDILPNEGTSTKRTALLTWIPRMAAAGILLTGLIWFFSVKESKQTVLANSEMQLAYEQAQEALLLVSNKMAKMNSINNALIKFDETQAKIKSSTYK
ncbi:MAG: hypothetical protein HKN16_08710 [Saprospiraceae bacterium]|nr:hypothetical protein [Saprospiraceae bacterium]